MKNKLPHKVTGPDTVGLGYWKSEVNEMTLEELQRSYNQLINYIAELTEVVEGRQNKDYRPEAVLDRVLANEGVVPILKETLLGNVRDNKWNANAGHDVAEEIVVSLSDVEAIINRLMP